METQMGKIEDYIQNKNCPEYFNKQFYDKGQPLVLTLKSSRRNNDFSFQMYKGKLNKDGEPAGGREFEHTDIFPSKQEAFEFAENYAKEKGFTTKPTPEGSKMKYKWPNSDPACLDLLSKDNPELLKAWEKRYNRKPNLHWLISSGRILLCFEAIVQWSDKSFTSREEIEARLDELFFSDAKPVEKESLTAKDIPAILNPILKWTLNPLCDTYLNKEGDLKLTNLDGNGWIGWIKDKEGHWKNTLPPCSNPNHQVEVLEMRKEQEIQEEKKDPYKQPSKINLKPIQKFVCGMVGGELGGVLETSDTFVVTIDRQKFFKNFSPELFDSFLKEVNERSEKETYYIIKSYKSATHIEFLQG